jgi:hypothetical protein
MIRSVETLNAVKGCHSGHKGHSVTAYTAKATMVTISLTRSDHTGAIMRKQ